MLLGQADNSTATLWGFLVGGGISALVGGVITLLSFIQKSRKESREDTIAEYRELLDKQDKRIEKQESEMKEVRAKQERETAELRASESKCQSNLARALQRIEALEDALEAHNIPFRRYKPEPGTGVNPPLPPAGGGS